MRDLLGKSGLLIVAFLVLAYGENGEPNVEYIKSRCRACAKNDSVYKDCIRQYEAKAKSVAQLRLQRKKPLLASLRKEIRILKSLGYGEEVLGYFMRQYGFSDATQLRSSVEKIVSKDSTELENLSFEEVDGSAQFLGEVHTVVSWYYLLKRLLKTGLPHVTKAEMAGLTLKTKSRIAYEGEVNWDTNAEIYYAFFRLIPSALFTQDSAFFKEKIEANKILSLKVMIEELRDTNASGDRSESVAALLQQVESLSNEDLDMAFGWPEYYDEIAKIGDILRDQGRAIERGSARAQHLNNEAPKDSTGTIHRRNIERFCRLLERHGHQTDPIYKGLQKTLRITN